MVDSNWFSPLIGVVGALLGSLITGVIAWVIWRCQQQQQTDEDRYRDWVTREYRSLNITGLRTRAPVEVELERVYVSLSVDPRAIAHLVEEEGPRRPGSDDFSYLLRQQERETLSMAEALSAIDHERIAGLVILGGPGTGKTTVLRYLALTYACGLQGERLDQSQPLLPLLIPLRAVTADHARFWHLSQDGRSREQLVTTSARCDNKLY